MSGTKKEKWTALVTKDEESGRLQRVSWHTEDGLPHCDFGPQTTTYSIETGNIVEERWLLNGQLTRNEEDGPAVIQYHPETNNPLLFMFYKNEELHRLDGPAYIEFDPYSGEVVTSEHYRSGEQFDRDKPIIEFPEP